MIKQFNKIEKSLLDFVYQGLDMNEIYEKFNYTTATLSNHFCKIYASTKDIVNYQTKRNRFGELQDFLQSNKGKIFMKENGIIIETSLNTPVDKKLAAEEFAERLTTLTSREKDVFNLLVQGYSYKQAAEHLNITLITLKTHVNAIFQKIQVNSLPLLVSTYYQYTPSSQTIETPVSYTQKITDLAYQYQQKIEEYKNKISEYEIKLNVLSDLEKELSGTGV